MKACFPIVGEKEYKDSISSTKQRQFVFTTPCIESVFISFVSISFNKLHVSVPTRTCIRVNGEIRVLNKFVLSALFVFKKIHGDIRVQQCVFTKLCFESVFISFVSFSFNKPHVSVPTRTCIREIGEIRVPNKFAFYSLVRDPKTVSATPRTNIRESAIRVQKNIRDIRFITSLRSVGLRRISCSKHLVRASKFIIGQFHIAASRNNSTFNIQNSTLRSAPPCAKKYS